MASLEELLRYLEQFMTGHLNQQHPATPGHGAIPGGAIPGGFAGGRGGGGGGPVGGGGMPQGAAMPGQGVPGGAMPGGTLQGEPMGEPIGGASGQAQLPPELADATPEQVHEALLAFAATHPELAPFFTAGNQPADLGAALSQLTGIPAEALAGYTPALSDFELGNFGGLAADEIGEWSQAQGLDPAYADPLSGLAAEPTGLASTLETPASPLDGIDGLDGLLSTGSDPNDLIGSFTDPGTLVSHDNVLGDLSGFSAGPGEFGNLAPTGFEDPGFAPPDLGGLAIDPVSPGADGVETFDHTPPVVDPTAPDDFTSGPVYATDHESPFSDSATDGSDQF